jgi:hypothetical protein
MHAMSVNSSPTFLRHRATIYSADIFPPVEWEVRSVHTFYSYGAWIPPGLLSRYFLHLIYIFTLSRSRRILSVIIDRLEDADGETLGLVRRHGKRGANPSPPLEVPEGQSREGDLMMWSLNS